MSDSNTGTPDAPLSVPAAIAQRRTTRSYLPDPIPDEVVERLLHLTVAAPSSWNFQPVRIVVVRDAERRAKLCEACYHQKQVREAPVVFVFAISHGGWRETMDDVIAQAIAGGGWSEEFAGIMRQQSVGFQEALGDGLREYNTKDALIAATHLALAAESMGLSSTFMNGYVEDQVKAVIGAEGDDDIGISLVMPIGVRATPGAAPGRLPLSRTVFAEALDTPWG